MRKERWEGVGKRAERSEDESRDKEAGVRKRTERWVGVRKREGRKRWELG